MKENKYLTYTAVALLILSILPFVISSTLEMESDNLDPDGLWVLKLISFLGGIGWGIAYVVALILALLELWKVKDRGLGWKILWAVVSLVLIPLGVLIYAFIGRNTGEKKKAKPPNTGK